MALALGWSLQRIDAMGHSDFVRWCKYYAAEPFGPQQENHRAAMITSAIYNSSTKFKNNHTAAQFMPNQRKKAQTMEEQIAMLKGVAHGKG